MGIFYRKKEKNHSMDLFDKYVPAIKEYVIPSDEEIVDGFICSFKFEREVEGRNYRYTDLGYKKPMNQWVVLTDKQIYFFQPQKELQKVVTKRYDELKFDDIVEVFLGHKVKILNKNPYYFIDVEIVSSKKRAFQFLTTFNHYCVSDRSTPSRELILGGKYSQRITLVNNNNLIFKNSGNDGGMYISDERVFFLDERAQAMKGMWTRMAIPVFGNYIADHNIVKSFNNKIDSLEIAKVSLFQIDHSQIKAIVYHCSEKWSSIPNSITFFWEGGEQFQGKNQVKLNFILREDMDYFINLFNTLDQVKTKMFNDSSEEYRTRYPNGIQA